MSPYDPERSLPAALEAVRARFFRDPRHVRAEEELSDLLDAEIAARLRDLLASPGSPAVMAAGGYGRRTLHPASDLDLLILPASERDHGPVSAVLSRLSGLGFEVGHQIVGPGGLGEFDAGRIGSYTAFFEARYLAGEQELASAFMGATLPRFVLAHRPVFFTAIDLDRARRHAALGKTPGDPEPDLKNGPGGLRDYHAIRWTGWVAGVDVPGKAERAAGFLQRVRNILHYLAHRDYNVLDAGRQSEIGRIMGYAGLADGLMPDCRRAFGEIIEARVGLAAAIRLEGESGAGGRRCGFPAVAGRPRPE